jgi:hypothetical protein
MKNLLIAFFFIFLFCGISKAQKETAENGFYPPGYVGGSTWSGVVISIDEDKQEITLTYTNGKKEQTFTGVLGKDYWGVQDKKGNYQKVKLSSLIGYRIKAYFSSKTKKDETGAKIKINQIYLIKILPKDK